MTPSRPISIRAGLRRSLLPWLGVLTVGGGAALYVFVRVALTGQFDAALLAKTLAIGSAAKVDLDLERGFEFDFGGEMHPEFQTGSEAEYFQLWFDDGAGHRAVAERSASLAGADLSRHDASDGPRVGDVTLPDGRRGRAAWVSFSPRVEIEDEAAVAGRSLPRLTLTVARSRAELDRPLAAMLAGLIGVGVLLSGGAAFVLHRAVRRALAPADELARAVSVLEAAHLPKRLEVAEMPSELEPVRARIDELLARVRGAIERERRFTGAAAHELRTPLAELASLLDVRIKWPLSIEECITSLSEARAVTARMAHLIEVLLALARSEACGGLLRLERHDLVAALGASLHGRRAEAEAKGLRIDVDAPRAAHLNADPAALTSILANIIGNAVDHTPRGGFVRVAVMLDHEAGTLTITNGPTNLTPEEAEHLFEPLWRKDAARGDVENGSRHLGLGLSLARSLAEAQGLRLSAAVRPEGVLEISLLFPLVLA